MIYFLRKAQKNESEEQTACDLHWYPGGLGKALSMLNRLPVKDLQEPIDESPQVRKPGWMAIQSLMGVLSLRRSHVHRSNFFKPLDSGFWHYW